MIPAAAETVAAFAVTGAVAGSFTATAVLRRLRRQQAMSGRSSCDHCGTTLTYAHTLPLVSYALNRGVCRTCSGPIDAFHPWGEAAGALIGTCVGSAMVCGAVQPSAAVAIAALGFCLLALSLTDLRTQRIPNALTGGVLLASLLVAASHGLGHLASNIVWAMGCFGSLNIVRSLFVRLKGEDGLGFGDVKLLSALAVWLGPSTPYALVFACTIALLVRVASGKFGGRMAFGPWIALGAWTVGLATELVSWAA